MKILVIDICGTSVKMLARAQLEPSKFLSSPAMTPSNMVSGVKELKALPPACRSWDNENAFIGGFQSLD